MNKHLSRTINELDKTLIGFVIQEKTNTEMAQKTGYSIGYIKRRLAYLFRLFGVKTKVGLVREIFKFSKSPFNTY
jgi:DNA-binding CsgD family transcriptional regulator